MRLRSTVANEENATLTENKENDGRIASNQSDTKNQSNLIGFHESATSKPEHGCLDEEKDHSMNLFSLDELAESISSQVLLNSEGDILIPPGFVKNNETPIHTAENLPCEKTQDERRNMVDTVQMEDEAHSDIKVVWAERPNIFLLRQLPQPRYLFSRGIQAIATGFDHLACLSYTGELCKKKGYLSELWRVHDLTGKILLSQQVHMFLSQVYSLLRFIVDCLGDNTYGQCGADPRIEDQRIVGIMKVRYQQSHLRFAS